MSLEFIKKDGFGQIIHFCHTTFFSVFEMIQLGVFEFIPPYWDKIGDAVNRVRKKWNFLLKMTGPICKKCPICKNDQFVKCVYEFFWLCCFIIKLLCMQLLYMQFKMLLCCSNFSVLSLYFFRTWFMRSHQTVIGCWQQEAVHGCSSSTS